MNITITIPAFESLIWSPVRTARDPSILSSESATLLSLTLYVDECADADGAYMLPYLKADKHSSMQIEAANHDLNVAHEVARSARHAAYNAAVRLIEHAVAEIVGPK